VSTGIATLVKSLGDFPLDPDQAKAWLWSGDGAHLLWQSSQAAEAIGAEAGHLTGVSNGGALSSFAQELTDLQPDRQLIRAVQLPLSLGRTSHLFICVCRHVPLADGSGYGLLTVSIDNALPRLTRGDADGPQSSRPHAVASPSLAVGTGAAAPEAAMTAALDGPAKRSPPDAEEPLRGPIDLRPAAIEARQVAEHAPTQESVVQVVESPAWTTAAPELRRPLRFVWQTDAEGRFAHVSRELSDALGAVNARVLGKRFTDVAADVGLREADDAEAMFRGTATWTALPVIWPVAGSPYAVPVEMAGMPVLELGAFSGFRGYGIIRIDRASVLAEPSAGRVPEASDALAQPVGATAHPPGNGREADASVVAEPPAPPATQLLNDNARAVAQDLSVDGPTDRLTASERNAFREIARALGSGRSADEASDTLPTAPHQMPEWIAKRQLGLTPDATAQPEKSALPEKPALLEGTGNAVVPLEVFQTRLEKRWRDAETGLLAAVLDKLPLATLVMQHGRPVHVSPAFLEMAGHKDLAAFNAAGGVENFFTVPPPNGEERDPRSIIVRRGDGVSVSVEAQVVGMQWEGGPATLTSFRPSATRAMRSDTELNAARSELAELRFVLDTAMDGVLSLDAGGRILAANRSAEALFGFDQKEIIGEPLTVLLEPESHAAALDYLQGLKADGVATIMNDGRDVVGRERHGGRIPLFMTLGRQDMAGDHARYCAVLRDVTIWKKSEAELTQARRAAEDANANKSDFLARISHEIRTPMNAVIGFADVMRNETFGPLGNERYKGYANDIHASGVHVVSLVNDLLDLSKIAAGKLDLTFGSVDLNQAVAESVSMIQPQANAGSVIVRTQLAQRMPPVVADQRSIRQIMINLLSNAAKFTEPGGQVVVTTGLTEAGEAAIRVRDTGIGMSDDDIRKALEPFRQIPGPKSQGGTGLGLPLTKALTEANRASFRISSEPGKGTLAEIVFPATRVLAE
jgi:PAS domain S-box-containing protein